MNISKIREAIPVTQNIVYMNTGWSGPAPSVVSKRIQEQLDLEMNDGPATLDTIARSHQVREELNSSVAQLLNTPSETVTLTQSTTHGIAIVVNGMEWRPGDELVTCSIEHSSVMVPSLLLQKSQGVSVKIADLSPMDDSETIISKIEQCISDKTRLVFLSHIQYSCGIRLPVKDIADIAHSRGAYLLLDGAQCAGQIVLDVQDMDCDFYSIAGHKWLLGPDGMGALFIRKELLPEITPRYPVHGAVEEWDSETMSVTMATKSSGKFGLSTTSIALAAGMSEAIAFNQEVGGAEIEARTMYLSRILRSSLESMAGIYLTCPSDVSLSSGLITFSVDGKTPAQIVEALWGLGIAARQVPKPEGIRLCTAFFNTEAEIECVVGAIANIIRE